METLNVNLVKKALQNLNGEAQAYQIKNEVRRLLGEIPSHYKNKRSFEETIHVIIQKHCPQNDKYCYEQDVFTLVSRGRYKLS